MLSGFIIAVLFVLSLLVAVIIAIIDTVKTKIAIRKIPITIVTYLLHMNIASGARHPLTLLIKDYSYYYRPDYEYWKNYYNSS